METWLEESGAVGLNNLELADFPVTGRGLRTLTRFKEGGNILTIPSGVLWTVEHAYADPILGPALRSTSPRLSVEDTLAVYILYVRSRESGYDGRRNHVERLPSSYSSSIFFTEEQLEVCAGTSLYTVTKQLEQSIENDHRQLVMRILGQHPDLFPLDKFNIKDYKWALCTVWSRSMDFALPEGKSIRLLAPFADMLNHSSEAKQCHVYDTSSGNLSIVAGKDYEAGDQVFINYGSIPNNRLLRLYGFVVPGNPNDSYDLVLATHPMAPFFEEKQKLWASTDLDSTSTVTLTLADPLPKAVLRYLRIQRLNESDIAVLALQQRTDVTNAKISDSNEKEVLEFLVQAIDGLLNNFGTQLEILEKQLAEGFYSPGENAWAAAHVSVGEQRVLRLAKNRAEDMLVAMDRGKENGRDSPSAPGRLDLQQIEIFSVPLSIELRVSLHLEATEEAYKKASLLAPNDPSPISNLSAVSYETGDYEGAIGYVRQALLLPSPEQHEHVDKDKLYHRMAKCFLHLRDLTSAKDAISSIRNADLRKKLTATVESVDALRDEVSDESVLRKQILDRVSRYKSSLQDIPEYFCVGHDDVDLFNEDFGEGKPGKNDLSFLFAGSGDGRNAFSAILNMYYKELSTKGWCFGKLHLTLLDLKTAALARVLIFFSMMVECAAVKERRGVREAEDHVLDMAYLFSCHIIPPFVAARLQSTISRLIDMLDGKLTDENNSLHFVCIPDGDKMPLRRVLRQWQSPCIGLSKVSDMRSVVRRIHQEAQRCRMQACHGIEKKESSRESGKIDFDNFATILPSAEVAQRREPPLVKPLALYTSTGSSVELLRYIDANWMVNNTIIDYDWADRSRQRGFNIVGSLEFEPLNVSKSMGGPPPSKSREMSPVESLAFTFKGFTSSVSLLSSQKRLVIELITGEMADVMERMRYNLLDHRLPSPNNSASTLDSNLFPRKYDYVHVSNIPEDKRSSLRFNNLLNPPEFQNHESFQSEYLLMYDMDRIRRHFLVTKRPGEVTDEQLPPMFKGLVSPFAFEGYMVWDRIPQNKMTFQELMPRAEFEKWIHGHLLKICLPYPRPIFSGSPVYAPLNLTTIIRLVIAMFEVGYPAHWLLAILSSMCTGVLTTSARPPAKRVCDVSDVDRKHPVQQSTIYPWVPELTTLLSIWRRLLPFGTDPLDALLVPLNNVCQYSVAFPPFQAENERYPHFMLLFWNTEIATTERPPESNYRLFLDGDAGDGSTSAKRIRKMGIVAVTAFRFHSNSRTAVFWMRSDKIEEMRAGKWRVFIWRTDAWTSASDGVDVSSGVVTGKKWTESAQSCNSVQEGDT
ncbi:hypothetical protein E4U21_005001 [Claviceps maximensis]|nr:hypothetical protein E4U21_005001 [Claviceps maximensis]